MHINLATEAAGQAGQNEMLKKYILFVKKKWETIEICPHPPPTDPLPGKAERSGNAVEKQKAKNWRRLITQKSKGYQKFSIIQAIKQKLKKKLRIVPHNPWRFFGVA